MLTKYDNTAVQPSPHVVVPGATFEFRRQSDNEPVAVFANSNGTGSLGSIVDADINGRISVFLYAGIYKIIVTAPGLSATYEHVTIVNTMFADPDFTAAKLLATSGDTVQQELNYFNSKYIEFYGDVDSAGIEIAQAAVDEITTAAAVINIDANFTLTKSLYIRRGTVVKPQTGFNFTVGDGGRVFAENPDGWYDLSDGGGVLFSAGAFERSLTRPAGAGSAPSINEGHPSNIIESSNCYVRGGTNSFPQSIGTASELSIIDGGYDNVIGDNATASTISGGAHHIIHDDASHATIDGGAYQEVTAAYGNAGSGTLNLVHSTFGRNCGGNTNVVGDPMVAGIDQRSSFNGAGTANNPKGLRSSNVGGFTNSPSGEDSFNGGGKNNLVPGLNGGNIAGTNANVEGANAVNLNGVANNPSGASSLTAGEGAVASGTRSVSMGESTLASNSDAWATGYRSRAPLRGQRSHGSFRFSASGDAQRFGLTPGFQTNGATPQNLDLFAGTSNPITLPNNTLWTFDGLITALRTDSGADYGHYQIKGGIFRGANAASTVLTAAVTPVTIANTAGASTWTVAVSAGTTNGDLIITVTGESGKTIRWLCDLRVSAVGNF